MERLTDCAQGFCEMYCKKYGHCFLDHGDCIFPKEVAMYERLKDYEGTGLEPKEINGLKLKVESLEMSLRVACDALDKLTKAEQDGRLAVLPCEEKEGGRP